MPGRPPDLQLENQWLRQLLESIAQRLDRLALEADGQGSRFREGAMWVRRQLREGPPAGASPGLGVGSGPRARDPETGRDRSPT